jgi:hypothetical protein
MNTTTLKYWSTLLLLPVCFSLGAQKINLDELVQTEELTLFQGMDDKNAYYYLLDKLVLGTHEADGSPQFSFVKFVDNERSASADEDIKEAGGGGIVHAVVELDVDRSAISSAAGELKSISKNKDAYIKGPVAFTEGTISIISSVLDPSGGFSDTLLGIGKAPLFEGGKAAFSILLDKKGANILWATFQTATPDMSFSFEGQIQGYRAPTNCWIKGDYDKIYASEEFNVGASGMVKVVKLAAEVAGSFERMREKNIIEIYMEGDDKLTNDIINSAYNKLADIIFEKVEDIGAIKQKLKAPAAARTSGPARTSGTGTSPGRTRPSAGTKSGGPPKPGAKTTPPRPGSKTTPPNPESKTTPPKTGAKTTPPKPGATTSTQPGKTTSPPQPGGTTAKSPASAGSGTNPSKNLTDKVKGKAGGLSQLAPFSVTAGFQIKRVKKSGTFEISMKRASTDQLYTRFDENVGPIAKSCKKCLQRVNLDDPMFKQREILVVLDGYNESDFGQFINYVTVTLRKTHQDGSETVDDVRIDRKNFVEFNNRFKLLYGWKGDDDRQKWLKYEYRVEWSFFGDYTVQEDWQEAEANAINLGPSLKIARVEFEADPSILADSQVRMVGVKVYYEYGAGEKMIQLRLMPRKNEVNGTLEFLLPKEVYDFEYEVTWTTNDNKKFNQPRQTSNDVFLFVDNVPLNE